MVSAKAYVRCFVIIGVIGMSLVAKAMDCASALSSVGRPGVIRFLHGTQRVVFQRLAELDITLGQYTESNGKLHNSYLTFGHLGIVDTPDSARKMNSDILQFPLERISFSEDRKVLHLVTARDQEGDSFEVYLTLSEPFHPTKPLDIIGVEYREINPNDMNFFNLYSGDFELLGEFSPFELSFGSPVAETIAAALNNVEEEYSGEQISLVSSVLKEMGAKLKDHLSVQIYRGTVVLFTVKERAINATIAASTPVELYHALSGLFYLGLSHHHPIFQIASSRDPYFAEHWKEFRNGRPLGVRIH